MQTAVWLDYQKSEINNEVANGGRKKMYQIVSRERRLKLQIGPTYYLTAQDGGV